MRIFAVEKEKEDISCLKGATTKNTETKRTASDTKGN